MMFYGFLMATLPELTPGQTPEISAAQFDELAMEHLSAGAMKKLTSWDRRSTGEVLPEIYRRMEQFDSFLRWRIGCLRAEKSGLNADYSVPEEFYSEIDHFLPSAAASNDPAERENAVDLIRWQKIDDLAVGHEFDLEHLCCYRLKLSMLEKHLLRKENNGQQVFEEAVNRLDTTQVEI